MTKGTICTHFYVYQSLDCYSEFHSLLTLFCISKASSCIQNTFSAYSFICLLYVDLRNNNSIPYEYIITQNPINIRK